MSPLFLLCLGMLPFTLASEQPFIHAATCGSTGRTCIQGEASCVDSECSCDSPYTWGKGDFRCYPPTVLACEIKNDPSLTTYGKESEQFPFPCRYLASHVRQQMFKVDSSQVIGSCDLQVYAFNSKAQGKIYVSGFDVALKIIYHDPYKVVESSFRQFAYASNNVNTGVHYGQLGQSRPFVPDGTDDISYHDVDNGIKVTHHWDDTNNRFYYKVEGCAIKITFVPYDKVLKLTQKQVPGLAVAVSELHNPTFLSHDEVMCLAPNSFGGQSIQEVKDDQLTRERSLLLRAFKADFVQNQVYSDGGQCKLISTALNDCQLGRQRQAMKKCDWILKQPHFLKCYDNTFGGERSLQLFRYCVEAWCTYRPCTQAITAIQNSGCTSVGGVPELTTFLAGNMCPGNA